MTLIQAISCEQARKIDKCAIEQFGFPGIVLMENAGRGCVDSILRHESSPVVLIGAGSGNNGGDGFVMARHLAIHGCPVRVIALGEVKRYSEDTMVNYRAAIACEIPIVPFSKANENDLSHIGDDPVNVFVDALLGTGATGAPRGDYASMIELANKTNWFRMAIDLPSGMNADTGLAHKPTLRADVTCTFVRPKIGFSRGPAQEYLGVVEVISIGIPDRLVEKALGSAEST